MAQIFHLPGGGQFVARLFRGEDLVALAGKIPASKDAGYSNPSDPEDFNRAKFFLESFRDASEHGQETRIGINPNETGIPHP